MQGGNPMVEDQSNAQDLENTVQPLDGDPVIDMKKSLSRNSDTPQQGRYSSADKMGLAPSIKERLLIEKRCMACNTLGTH
jgi:hypothetical protein